MNFEKKINNNTCKICYKIPIMPSLDIASLCLLKKKRKPLLLSLTAA